MDGEELGRRLVEGTEDAVAHSARVAVSKTVASALAMAGHTLYVGGWVFRDKATESLGVVTDIGGELAGGAVQLFESEHWYAGAALVRQLIEVEYLTWLFSEDPAVGAAWLDSSPAEIRQQFKPVTMRQKSAGRFRDAEYSVHSNHGGHPSPQGRLLLKNHSTPMGSHRWAWVDLAQHLERLWGHLDVALQATDAKKIVPAEGKKTVAHALAEWHQVDPLADRLPPEIFG